ncbi:DUF4358 domain-containing protein [Paenibacillus harenae]|uniref:DUF4358 domain-containing protein n=1 Tax=Paenibacillus harenae TaxID=306543 RepID=UPI00278E8DD2|nr:DUF4358 domain-containing protein [Paenibacillus harenae]MDQ0063414.1 hypothetical protein [Paenibacillus harenae]
MKLTAITTQNNKKRTKITALIIACSILMAGCGSGTNEAASSDPANTNTSANANSSVNGAGNDTASNAPGSDASTSANDTPASDTPEFAAAATTRPTETPASDAAPVKPTTKPAVKPTSKPAAKPTAKPMAKPTKKPVATDKPTQKPAAAPKPKPSQKPEVTVSASDIVAKITADVELPRLVTVEGDRIKDVYGIEAGTLLSDAVFMQAMMNTKATELVVVKLKSDKDYDAVKESLDKRATSIIKTFETYLQDQYEEAKNYQILRNGNYVMLSISNDQESIAEIFNDFFK